MQQGCATVLLAALILWSGPAPPPPAPDFTGGPALRFAYRGEARAEEMVAAVERRLEALGVAAAVDCPAEGVVRVRLTATEKDREKAVAAAVTLLGTVEFRRTVEPGQTRHYAAYVRRLPREDAAASPVTIPALLLPDDDRARFPHGLRWYPLDDRSTIAADRAPEGRRWMLCRLDPHTITHESLHAISAGRLQEGLGADWAVYFSLREDAQERMAALTAWEEDAYLAIVLDGRVHSAPVLRDTLREKGQISGGFGEDEARALAVALAAGPLPAPLVPVGG